METKESYAVVTGASQGLGKAFAENLAKKQINVILVSLPGQCLEDVCRNLEENYKIKAHYYEVDLSVNDNVLQLTKWINQSFNIHILINNAGLGGTKKFTEATSDYINTILQVNVAATSLITHQLLPNLLRQPKAYILNVSSMAAFSPIGFKTVYPASKTFIHSFSRGLHEELKDTNVFVSVVNPGAMKTNKDVCKRIEKQGFLGKLTLLDPDHVASYSIRQLFKKDSVIMVNPISWLIMKILPIWIKLPLMTQAIKKEMEA
ncbi:SDR family NAD(P)-dependent oxidoreductase [Chryseobacterium indologenes]|uniref:SDR family NAD(P)-dependent oxidoreductase n=1 Tax=Chryseobacterium indologenes TaxID=253 RepID=UPI000F502F67|nr:SDR family NAD(P)-dependent oxidoreductase [Chryseobacterium indologenes]AYZ35437.1 SDR family NAD(P)-dependent oxidoreductase [Chryseobacterium indologenes]MBF6644188.1 SDR family NAD(P)-dependent oxidoreductase [Chryseobacterium indologenes]MBU3047928.1 SDR family NAD(P)-dependent oxidoreductase [Chryseobacterium indologenes]MEB4763159.1 SDR family NAD(P)-dependent oxidoreductase [Chryseobacterium indologenes]QQQ72097.1 SDR family NAD(P)-dependent oxidoreductase [Chryseobacterium indologe